MCEHKSFSTQVEVYSVQSFGICISVTDKSSIYKHMDCCAETFAKLMYVYSAILSEKGFTRARSFDAYFTIQNPLRASEWNRLFSGGMIRCVIQNICSETHSSILYVVVGRQSCVSYQRLPSQETDLNEI
jgi:hypothetical protein